MSKAGLGLCALFFATTLTDRASAEVTAKGESGFQIRIKRELSMEPQQAYKALTDIGKWWSDAHTYSGSAANMSLNLEKGWFQEKLPEGGYVRHMDIVYYQAGKALRMTGGLGPLQAMGHQGALTMTLSAKQEGGTSIVWTYNVSGYAPDGLAALAPLVDAVLTEQLDRLVKFRAEAAHDGNESVDKAPSQN